MLCCATNSTAAAWSDVRSKCAELEFLVTGDPVLERAFKVPSLRNVAERAPYMHAGQIATLREVVDHYNRAPEAPAGHDGDSRGPTSWWAKASASEYRRTSRSPFETVTRWS